MSNRTKLNQLIYFQVCEKIPTLGTQLRVLTTGKYYLRYTRNVLILPFPDYHLLIYLKFHIENYEICNDFSKSYNDG